MRVSPAAGMRDVRVMRSVLREPITVMVGFVMLMGKGPKVCDYSGVVCLASSIRACWGRLLRVTLVLASRLCAGGTLN